MHTCICEFYTGFDLTFILGQSSRSFLTTQCKMLFFTQRGPENAGEQDYQHVMEVKGCLEGLEGGREITEITTLSLAQRSLTELSKKVKVQVLKSDSRVVVPFSMKVMTVNVLLAVEPPTSSEINDADEGCVIESSLKQFRSIVAILPVFQVL